MDNFSLFPLHELDNPETENLDPSRKDRVHIPPGPPPEQLPYERLLRDAMNGNGALFTREDAVEAAWTVIEPVLKSHRRSIPYKRGSWGPKEADALIATDGGWHNPLPEHAGTKKTARDEVSQIIYSLYNKSKYQV